MKIRGIEVEERYIEEEIDDKDRIPWVTWMQPTFIWTGDTWGFIGLRHGDVSDRNITVDVRNLIEKKIPLLKTKYKREPKVTREKDGKK